MKKQVEVSFLQPPLFNLQSDYTEVMSFLEENGFIVFEKVLDAEEISLTKSKFWDFLEGLGSGIDRKRKDTWVNANWPNSFNNGIISEHGIGQSKLSWYLRKHPNVRKIFSNIWGTESLLTSFDGGCVFRPPIRYTGKDKTEDWSTNGGWYHVDQDYFVNSELECYQGFVTLLDADASSGGLVIVPKSQSKFSEYFSKKEKHHSEFIRIPEDDLSPHFGEPVLLGAPAGSMVIWDSRMVHCNSPPLTKPRSQTEVIRMVMYICMLPKENASQGILKQRRLAVKNGTTTSHWPTKWHPKKPPRFPRSKYGFKTIGMSTDVLSVGEIDEDIADLIS
eukprot:TRINITY_DN186_c0_g1_i2.p1 TRINITY_DN186_c0_g1~~TRINITY_DN186_c0_g1_i2.p1  ORF type:complete len:384 (-),score=76.41 TRINITY_DN186_c0_g1_i2:27-1028(-)